MNNKKEGLQFLGRPNIDGSYFFQGIPIVNKQVIDLIGNDGIKKIDNQMKEMVEWKKIIYRNKDIEQKGFRRVVEFADYTSRRILSVGQRIEDNLNRYNLDSFQITENLKIDNFKLLKLIDHYFIAVNEHVLEVHFEEYLSDFYA